MTWTDKEIHFFSSKEWLQALDKLGGWEPKFGDWGHPKYLVQREYHRTCGAGVITGLYDGLFQYRVEFESGTVYMEKADLIPLFTVDQLIEMLEERGYIAGFSLWQSVGGGYGCGARHKDSERQPFNGWDIQGRGLRPTIALAKCLMEVMKEEK